ncbi:Gfo/Idh/MocA family protein [Marivita geojedonensis]|uniref:Oxidoreductase n=1 Tax=Marivita geojedonensis TaxID=1123756 RepID=A0A1X4NPQ9_9RHOB|nr:Gfo/Idh/MocA family oxidoreductase [Marivita geojedonensis]OSQ52695.1 oxidoreductase [Marivita geojedonensis]PRY80919.1 putative dehydrogenase [Marivita geojedonensis]
MAKPLRFGLAGYGLVGRRHAASISQAAGATLAAVVETDGVSGRKAKAEGFEVFTTIQRALLSGDIDGMILATPNTVHVEQALQCVEMGCPVLIEKPIANSASDAKSLVAQAAARQVPVLVGHHRRHNPIIKRARQIIEDGQIGDVRAVQASCWFYKPDTYFEAAPWRRQAGAGPISVNLVHDVDLLRHLIGEVVSVRAIARPARRGGANEDVASALLDFANGAVGTITVSDSIVAPWSWEMTAGEYPIYPRTSESCYLFGGSLGSLSLPDLRVWRHEGEEPDWWTPISATAQIREGSDPLVNQIAHFRDVIQGNAAPLVPGEEGVRTLEIIEAIQQSVQSGETISIG